MVLLQPSDVGVQHGCLGEVQTPPGLFLSTLVVLVHTVLNMVSNLGSSVSDPCVISLLLFTILIGS